MSGDDSMQKLLEEMKKQMSELQEQVERMQRAGTSTSFEEPGEEDLTTGELVELFGASPLFSKGCFSATLSNADCKKWIENIGIPDYDKIHCHKLDSMLTAILPKDAIKVDGYLSCLQPFWLDAVAPLAAILKGSEAEELTPEHAYLVAQAALVLMGSANNHMMQERCKRILMNVNPALKSMANQETAFQQAAPMLFGEEFAKKATDRVEAIKAIKKISYQKLGERRPGHFFGYHPWNQADSCRGGYRSGHGRFQPYPNTRAARTGSSNPGPSQGCKNN